MSNETKIRNDMLVWGLTSAGENALERRDGDAGIEKMTRNTRGKKEVGISARMRGQWFIEAYVERMCGVSHATNGELAGVGGSTGSRSSPLKSDSRESNRSFRPVQSSGEEFRSPPNLAWPQASRKHRQRVKLRTLPPRTFVADTKTEPAAPLSDPSRMRY